MKNYFLMMSLALSMALAFTTMNVNDAFASKGGKKVFKKKGCQACHSKEKGTSKPFPSMQQLAKMSYNDFSTVVKKGKTGTMMKAYPKITDKEMKAMYDWLQKYK